MKKVTILLISIFALAVGAYLIWWRLPVTINRSADVKLGNEIINKIETYSLTNKLPENNDWENLRQFGFKDKIDFLQPEYSKLDDHTFELIFVGGFDEPYLMWNSKERKWKNGFPTIKKNE
ncbi:hypothetical protein KLP40_10640 [Hymenobacter sp. NST-14]|uniref:hypothetical protein n=1 Tax=Hymenobacter piscis TaxID=2839984 RepID=UPI001C0358C3|nr:hypothetical protein [Hymenobacter piscis]MBT9393619.1 hypothetical protein [Hymenobacter piscis]